MTREEILAMKPGRVLDALVAKYVRFPRHTHPIEEIKEWCSKYTTDISAAWEVVEEMQKTGGLDLGCYSSWFECYITRDNFELRVTGNTAQEAICKAALLAVLGEEEA